TLDTIAKLAEHPNIQAIKDATGTVENITPTRECSDLAILSGDDSLTLPMLSLGAVGVVSVLSNLLPDQMSKLVQAALENDLAQARKIHETLFPLMRALSLETNPLPIKTALALEGRISEEFRLPLCHMADENRERLVRALAGYSDELAR
ncbi:MAG: dihydrodipicolinate synthase family protein, partial [Planctomycetota bacterium]